jgi:UDP-hydrolysing UDP-N-acetyl-D-glucosamine 2-epimerase
VAAGARKMCVVTRSRADYGLLFGVMRAIEQSPALDLQILAVGSHYSAAHGMTIEADGFSVDGSVRAFDDDDGVDVDVAAVAAATLVGASVELGRLAPDAIVVLGDRYEIFAVATAATQLRILIAHIAGGDVTEGAYDEVFRQGLTKIAHVHFATNDDAARRVRQLGEDPASVHLVGSPGIDYIACSCPCLVPNSPNCWASR